MRSEHLHQWLIDDNRDDRSDSNNWQNFVAIVQAEFHNGTLVKEITWQTAVLISEGVSIISRGFVLFKVLWKSLTSLLNRRLMSAIKVHDKLHRFWSGRGTGTVALEANLLQQLTSMREAVLFKVLLLDLHKSYDSMDWYICLEILASYGFISRTLRILHTYWDQLTMVARAGGYFGLPFKGYRGVTQGDPLSPTLLKVAFR